ncbi:hypothetical protein [Streptosporangium amethystogenes]|nr:hypothetical protein [Streptosporangium amethystogenes]
MLYQDIAGCRIHEKGWQWGVPAARELRSGHHHADGAGWVARGSPL